MKIIIDSREPEFLVKLFEEKAKELAKPTVIITKTLKVGDIKSGGCVIERKDVADFVASLFDGRLFTQLYRMCFYYPWRFVIVVGSLRTISYNLKPFWSAVASCLVNYQTPILFVDTEEELVYLAFKIFEKIEKGAIPTIPIKKKDLNNLEGIKVSLLCCFPGISKARAKKILDYFNYDMKKILEARDLLPSIIGQKAGTKLKNFLEEIFGLGAGVEGNGAK